MTRADPQLRASIERQLQRQGYRPKALRSRMATRIMRGTRIVVGADGTLRGTAEFTPDQAAELLASIGLVDRIDPADAVEAARLFRLATRSLTDAMAARTLVAVRQSRDPYRTLRRLASNGEDPSLRIRRGSNWPELPKLPPSF
jgi:hypothetical protein